MFESRDKIGGVLRYGIPEFRLPKSILDRYKTQLVKLGIKIRPNTVIGTTLTLDDLQRDGYKAIFIGTGVWRPRQAGYPRARAWAMCTLPSTTCKIPTSTTWAATWWSSARATRPWTWPAPRCARGVRHVTVFCRRLQAAASQNEIDYAIADGVEFLYGARPVEITDDGVRYQMASFDGDGNVTGLSRAEAFPLLQRDCRRQPGGR